MVFERGVSPVSFATGVLVIAATCLCPDEASADFLRVTQVGASSGVLLTFDSTVVGSNNGAFQGNGFSPTPGTGQLDSASWAVSDPSHAVNFGGTASSGHLARGPYPNPEKGPPNSGGINAADVNNVGGQQNWALGVKPSNSFSPSVYLRVVNATGATAATWNVGHELYVRNNTDDRTRVSFDYAVGATSITDPASLTYLPATANYVSPGPQNANDRTWALANSVSSALAALVPNGQALYLRWRFDDALVSGSSSSIRDGFAIDNVRVGVSGTSPVPEPASVLLTGLAAVGGAANYLRRRKKAASAEA